MTNIEPTSALAKCHPRYMHIPSLPLSLTDAKHKIGKKHKKNIAWGKKIGGPVANANPPSNANPPVSFHSAQDN